MSDPSSSRQPTSSSSSTAFPTSASINTASTPTSAPPCRPFVHNAPPSSATSSSSSIPSTSTNPTSAPVPRRRVTHHAPSASSGSVSAGRGAGAAVGPVKPGGTGQTAVRRPLLNTILVNTCQKGNPVLSLLRQTPWEYSDITPDYQLGSTSCALFLSLRYHRLHPEYIHGRIAKLGRMYMLRVLLVLCDVEDHDASLRELTKVTAVNDLTLMVAWSNAEIARYLELYKSLERKSPDLIKGRIDNDYLSRLNSALTSVRGVNKTDVVTLASNFGSLKRISQASPDDLALCPGLGEKKVKRLREAFSAPFVLKSKQGGTSEAEKRGNVGNELN